MAPSGCKGDVRSASRRSHQKPPHMLRLKALAVLGQVTQLGHVKDLSDAFVKVLDNPKAKNQARAQPERVQGYGYSPPRSATQVQPLLSTWPVSCSGNAFVR